MRFYREVLGRAQQRVLQALGPRLDAAGFYLAGGTALALQLGHRRSIDFDWFHPGPVEDPLRLVPDLGVGRSSFTPQQVAPGTLTGIVLRVRLSLLEYRYPLLEPLVTWPALGCRLASLAELAAMKLSAVAQRGAKKDFIDVYALARHGLTLRQMLGWYQQKFGVSDVAHVLYSLVYFEDAERERTPRMLWRDGWPAIRQGLRQWVEEFTRA
jgi:Nucleotidyl transferase AbiEii toxin, Type IV TA system